jgi:hypothetical protein
MQKNRMRNASTNRKNIMEKLTTIIETTLNVALGIAVCGSIPALIVFAFFTQN